MAVQGECARRTKSVLALAVVLLLGLLAMPACAEKWTFAAVGDNRSEFDAYRNVLEEIRNRRVNPDRSFAPVEFVIGCGDISPMGVNDRIYREVLGEGGPPFFPVRGNHDQRMDVMYMLKTILPSHGERIKLHEGNGLNYHADWKNVRLIVLDQFSDFAGQFKSASLLRWIEETIQSAVHADHVFIAFHVPYAAADPLKDPFWSMLLKHKDKVRAVFSGHTHWFWRTPVTDDDDSIMRVGVGNAGQISHSDRRQTVVEVSVDGKKVFFRTVQADDRKKNFKLMDSWEMKASNR